MNECIVRIPVDQSCGFQCLFKLQNSNECRSIGEMGHTYFSFLKVPQFLYFMKRFKISLNQARPNVSLLVCVKMTQDQNLVQTWK